jgi:toxin ParE1/3/4
MNIRWSPEAANDLLVIVEFIHNNNPSAATRVALVVFERVESLSSFPELGRLGRVKGTRELVLAPLPFIVVYRAKPEFLEIIRVLHGSQRWP